MADSDQVAKVATLLDSAVEAAEVATRRRNNVFKYTILAQTELAAFVREIVGAFPSNRFYGFDEEPVYVQENDTNVAVIHASGRVEFLVEELSSVIATWKVLPEILQGHIDAARAQATADEDLEELSRGYAHLGRGARALLSAVAAPAAKARVLHEILNNSDMRDAIEAADQTGEGNAFSKLVRQQAGEVATDDDAAQFCRQLAEGARGLDEHGNRKRLLKP